MLTDPSQKYRPFPQVDLPNRQWPAQQISAPPRWLSTDMRDGNQSLIDPMDSEKKRRFFDLLVRIGLKEIEVGFPSAGATEFDFISGLVKSGAIPEDVTVQVLTQSRKDLIDTTFESLRGAKTAIVHLYNAVSPAWRQIVFKMDREEVKQIAIDGAKLLRDNAAAQPDTEWHFEYSPETFSTAELDFSLEVCEAVMDILQPTPDRPLILNLPATVEAATPNIYADQIEWFGRNISRRDSVLLSLHPHNDRGTGVAAAELGLMAGADRVEGCLFGNGERTGNVCLVTLGMNLYTQGVDPKLDFSDMDEIVKTAEYCNQLPVHPRHPYAGDLVFTAFSGSHQDAIKKGFEAQEQRNDELWQVPYLPLDPRDIGRDYEAVIRVNSQSGKGGVAWVLQQDQGLKLPKRLQARFSRTVQALADSSSRELQSGDIWQAFRDEFHLDGSGRFDIVDYEEQRGADGDRVFTGKIRDGETVRTVAGRGNGIVSSVIAALKSDFGVDLDVQTYSEHAIGKGSGARAAAYVECALPSGETVWGVGIDEDVATASVRAVLSAASRS
ncbi:2-isopropylmalate synthase [Pacificimonas flava]|uniref:2-isopropylmalate synthase n=2 Tax=Pacificimonas TaxID=1960290 RepID=A0A219B6N6_9SPHN|nr:MULTISPECIES: 2-isopropylmalate synthase [Pacificimonas]MBZ6378940.1 2-isopropylmalate synthase [Pacificimonas aurantium]OWV33813.1 2-isopropylmalate synthase [Pacificimonas flava]